MKRAVKGRWRADGSCDSLGFPVVGVVLVSARTGVKVSMRRLAAAPVVLAMLLLVFLAVDLLLSMVTVSGLILAIGVCVYR